MRDNPGAQYEISVDGVPRTHRAIVAFKPGE
jgi:hypothetical protein